MSKKEIDEFTGVETTGHEWDGIKELNNPLPRWWLWTFYASIIFAFGYMIYYPAIPLIKGSTMGISGETNRSVLVVEMAAAKAAKADLIAKVEKASVEEIAADEELRRFAISAGSSLFKVNCVQCHGSGAQGSVGYPNLNDDDWLWGGDLESIYTTVAHGARYELDEDTRVSDMPVFGDDQLEDADIAKIAEHVLKLSGSKFDAAKQAEGAPLYEENCASCHGEEGKGGREFGAPNIADALWLYSGSREGIVAQITTPKHGEMPAWQTRLGDVSVKQLAVYVHSLGGGEKAPSE
jgi:cytochrome c oxidase cbb3-type subunit 3